MLYDFSVWGGIKGASLLYQNMSLEEVEGRIKEDMSLMPQK